MDAPLQISHRPAFVTTHYPFCSLSSIPHSSFTCHPRLVSTTTHLPRAVARRQRLRATATPPNPDDTEEEDLKQEKPTEEQPTEEKPAEALTSPEDVEISDLALPSLRDLFAATGKPGCEQCNGTGEISCPVCEAKGFVSLTMMDTTSSVQCRMCKGHRIVPCPTCRDMVYKSVLWWDQIPSKEEDPNEDWRQGPDGPRISWQDPPTSA